MKNMIRNSIIFSICLFTTVSAVYAAVVPAETESSLLIVLFVGFFALIIVLQLVPACLLFIGLLKGLLFQEPKTDEKTFTSE